MKDLTATLDTNAAAAQSGWTEVYDIYLREAITTPWGTTATLRLTPCPGGLAFFTPTIAPEPAATQGDAATYAVWPIMRARISGQDKISGDKLQITASNVTAEWAAMVQAVDWRGTKIVIRKIPLNVASLVAADCAVVWSGLVESYALGETQIVLTGGAQSADLNLIAPRQNMHQACRHKWADDYCTAIRFAAKNYAAKTCGNSCTTTRVYSAGLTEDLAAENDYGTDWVNSRFGTGDFSQSSYLVKFTDNLVYVGLNPPYGYGPGYFTNFDYPVVYWFYLIDGQEVTFTAGTLPTGISAATTYYARDTTQNSFRVSATLGGAAIIPSSAGSNVRFSTAGDFKGEQVCIQAPHHWAINGVGDWGSPTSGYYVIPDAQAGLANGDLKPWVDFDLDTARYLRVWQVKIESGTPAAQCLRLLSIFGSANRTDWTHVAHWELPPVSGEYIELLLPESASYRYWRVCCRSRWGELPFSNMIKTLRAFTDTRNYWAWGRITFDAATATAALQGVSRRIYASYAGVVHCVALPAAPANGDTFKIERGCRRTFNACVEKRNWENFGGFLDLPFQAIIR